MLISQHVPQADMLVDGVTDFLQPLQRLPNQPIPSFHGFYIKEQRNCNACLGHKFCTLRNHVDVFIRVDLDFIALRMCEAQ
jgi:hypothetical protein